MKHTFRKLKSAEELVEKLGLIGLTGLPQVTHTIDEQTGESIVIIDFPGVTLTSEQQKLLEKFASDNGWGSLDDT